MSTAATFFPAYAFNRSRTLGLLDTIEKEPNPAAILGWRPGPGRAHIAWQLMHIFITEEIFATERLNPAKVTMHNEFWARFRGGSTPDDNIPTIAELRSVAQSTRERLLDTLNGYGDDRLKEIPPSLAARGINVETVLHIISWHEAHHHGQAHITLNLYKASHA